MLTVRLHTSRDRNMRDSQERISKPLMVCGQTSLIRLNLIFFSLLIVVYKLLHLIPIS